MIAKTCKLCGKESKLIKAHIIPESFYRLDLYACEVPRIVSTTVGSFPKRSPIGVYDESILCGQCDKEIGIYDQYASQLLVENVSQFSKHLTDDSKPMCFSCQNYDYKKLKLFLMSVLWRAAISNQNFCEKVSLGPFLGKLFQMISNKNPGNSQTFACFLARFDPSPGVCIMNPVKAHFEVNIYQFYLADYVAYIKVDNRNLGPPFMHLMLQESKPLTILARDFGKSKELDVMRVGIKRLEKHGYF